MLQPPVFGQQSYATVLSHRSPDLPHMVHVVGSVTSGKDSQIPVCVGSCVAMHVARGQAIVLHMKQCSVCVCGLGGA